MSAYDFKIRHLSVNQSGGQTDISAATNMSKPVCELHHVVSFQCVSGCLRFTQIPP